MINGKQNRYAILDLLRDGQPHFSAEFRDRLNLLEYRKRLSELRREGYQIISVKIDKRPGYRLIQPQQFKQDLFA